MLTALAAACAIVGYQCPAGSSRNSNEGEASTQFLPGEEWQLTSRRSEFRTQNLTKNGVFE
ncbi:hypothetical protein BH10PLA2_BH10PLA2_06830 [soil metagenome]